MTLSAAPLSDTAPDPDRPPNFTPGGSYPLGGVQIGPAWRRAWRVLCVGGWVPVDLLAAEMRAAGGIQDKTARCLLAKARARGVLQVRHRHGGHPRRLRSQYRIRATPHHT